MGTWSGASPWPWRSWNISFLGAPSVFAVSVAGASVLATGVSGAFCGRGRVSTDMGLLDGSAPETDGAAGGNISDCYSAGSVSGSDYYVGDLVGITTMAISVLLFNGACQRFFSCRRFGGILYRRQHCRLFLGYEYPRPEHKAPAGRARQRPR